MVRDTGHTERGHRMAAAAIGEDTCYPAPQRLISVEGVGTPSSSNHVSSCPAASGHSMCGMGVSGGKVGC